MGIKAKDLTYNDLTIELESALNCSEEVLNNHKDDILKFLYERTYIMKEICESEEVITISFNLYWIKISESLKQVQILHQHI